jgi:signal recognition particle subunit SRP54
MGDVVSLVERQNSLMKKKLEVQKKIAKTNLVLMISKFQQVKKMGNMKDLVGMIPGASKAMKDEIEDDAFKHMRGFIL